MALLSMTGFGRANFHHQSLHILVEIKSVNGKNQDLYIKSPSCYNELDMELRKVIQEKLVRGSISLFIQRQDHAATATTFNKPLLQKLLADLESLSANGDKTNLLSSLIRLPEVVQTEQIVVSDEERKGVLKALNEAIEKLNEFRIQEGNTLTADMLNSNTSIQNNLKKVQALAPERYAKQKAELQRKLSELGLGEQLDNNRLEQELLYYVERLDINEECVRLQNHCNYLIEVMNGSDISKGKKLSFIAQEMVREINTTGSKANDSSMQKIVVQMKEDAEKIKEQILNVL
jgi:uncharacterized protein (TIGR00255 family)